MNQMKKMYLAPAVQIKEVAVENGFEISVLQTEVVQNNATVNF